MTYMPFRENARDLDQYQAVLAWEEGRQQKLDEFLAQIAELRREADARLAKQRRLVKARLGSWRRHEYFGVEDVIERDYARKVVDLRAARED